MSRFLKVSLLNSKPPAAPSSLQQGPEAIECFWRAKLNQVLPDNPDLIVLPEFCDMFSDSSAQFNMEYSESTREHILNFFQGVAQAHRSYLAYPGIVLSEEGSRYNTMTLIDREGEIVGIYSKNYPTIDEIENYHIVCGTEAPIFECDFGRVGCAICFDLNFDELRLQYAALRPDIILFPSWFHGSFMQQYWAFSCRSFFLASVAGLPSAILSPVGQELASTTNYFNYVTTTINLDCEVVHLDYNWQKLEQLKSHYGPHVDISDPGLLGSVLVTSQCEENVNAMLRAFDIEVLDEYLARARRRRLKSLA